MATQNTAKQLLSGNLGGSVNQRHPVEYAGGAILFHRYG
jgi:hypothetical protein